jgi:RNA polymerase-binding transcription factor DksA
MEMVNGRPATATATFLGQAKVLLEKKADLLLGLRGKLETFIAPENAAAEDLAPVSHDQSVALQLNRLEFLQVKLINAALERINTEEYGTCHDCGAAIPARRLDAIPWAIRCVGCEERSTATAAAFDDDQVAA